MLTTLTMNEGGKAHFYVIVSSFTVNMSEIVSECVFLYTPSEGTDKIFLPLVGPGAFQLPLAPSSQWPAPNCHTLTHTHPLWLEKHIHRERQKDAHTYRRMRIYACIHSSQTNMHPRLSALIHRPTTPHPPLGPSSN